MRKVVFVFVLCGLVCVIPGQSAEIDELSVTGDEVKPLSASGASNGSSACYIFRGKIADLPLDPSRLAVRYRSGSTHGDRSRALQSAGLVVTTEKPTGVERW